MTRGFCPQRHAKSLAQKDYKSNVIGLEDKTFNVGKAIHARRFQKVLENLSNYVQKEYMSRGPTIAKAMKDLLLPTLTLPDYPTAVVGMAAPEPGVLYLWRLDITEANKKIIQLKENTKRAYTRVYGQCSPELQSKIKGSQAFAIADQDQDVVQLLITIRGYCCRFDDHQQGVVALKAAKHRVSTLLPKEQYVQYGLH
jgi:hypothetical protein